MRLCVLKGKDRRRMLLCNAETAVWRVVFLHHVARRENKREKGGCAPSIGCCMLLYELVIAQCAKKIKIRYRSIIPQESLLPFHHRSVPSKQKSFKHYN